MAGRQNNNTGVVRGDKSRLELKEVTYEIFDDLPPRLRKAIRESSCNFSMMSIIDLMSNYMTEYPDASDRTVEDYILRCVAKTECESKARLYQLYENGELKSENAANSTG